MIAHGYFDLSFQPFLRFYIDFPDFAKSYGIYHPRVSTLLEILLFNDTMRQSLAMYTVSTLLEILQR